MGFELDLPLAEVLRRYSDGPQDGVFTDGAARPNPGPGGWGFVYVEAGEIIAQNHGSEEHTTNNRMELKGLIEAFKRLPEDAEVSVFSDSELCVKSMNEWAPGWKAKGWKRKAGPIANLELVQELFELKQSHKKVKLQWVKAHNGWLWNEYADSLATAWARSTL
jgi:ribonuclease HI